MGVTPEVIAQIARMGGTVAVPPAQPRADYELCPANADSLQAFLALQSQWRVSVGMKSLIWLGLDYAAVDVVLRRLEFSNPAAVFSDLLLMEEAALTVLTES